MIYEARKTRGSWFFDSKSYEVEYDNKPPYPKIISDLKILLSILIKYKLLYPKLLGGEGKYIDLNYHTIDELIILIETSDYLQNSFEFDIKGDTVIYTEQGEEVYSEMISLFGYRTTHQQFSLSTKSDIWLPMSFDEDSYSFVWNLERYNLNYHRIPSVLKKINETLGWENENLLVKEFQERGCLQKGYDIFLSQEVITREYKENPNPDFNFKEYIAKIEG